MAPQTRPLRNFDVITNPPKGHIPETMPSRPPKLNNLGKECNIGLNTYHVTQFPIKPVYQYDVQIIGGAVDSLKRMVIGKVWHSKTIKSKLDPSWIFDGNKLAWSLTKLPGEQTIHVDLAAERGGKPSEKQKFQVIIRPSKVVKFDLIRGYLDGKCDWQPEMLESMSFLDHLIREQPSQKFTQIKKSFFADGQARFSLGNGIEAFKGVFASMRMVNTMTGPQLSINVDVANGTFFTAMPVLQMAQELCRGNSTNEVSMLFNRSKANWHSSPLHRFLKALKHVTVLKKHMRGKDGNPAPEFKIHRFLDKDPYEITFDVDKEAKTKSTVAAYFKKQYNITCLRDMPCIELTKKGEYAPIETLLIPQNQRYRLKLDEKQTSGMIKFAVTLPAERWSHIQQGVNMLSWSTDPYLKNYGLKISPTRAEVKGRILPTPEPTFANGKIDARTASSGRWRIDGKKFLTPNPKELKAWGIGIINYGRGPCVAQSAASQFFIQFKKIYGVHGGKVGTAPLLVPLQIARGGEMITDLWNAVGNKFQMKPELLFFVVGDRNSEVYNRIKKSCECRYGVVSQVLQSQHVSRCQDQYISNVCMKVNAKLGGSTCRAASTVLAKLDPTFAKIPTLIIGADVSHASPGSEEGSMAALTASMTTDFTRYAALCQSNGQRVEIISTEIIMKQLKQLIELWMSQPAMRGCVPQRVLYYRDGVSSGQYQHVLEQEVADIRRLFKAINPQVQPKITVIICAKRHHIRFFPAPGHGDRNGNPNPGTLVETGCTNPFEFDFYLNSHSAIKGTARPVHYHVILDECKIGPMVLQQVTFEHCFQYIRSTTPVSMFPAVYYAHLASNRAKAHQQKAAVSSGKKDTIKGEPKMRAYTLNSSDRPAMEILDLLPLNNGQDIVGSMWYI
ncbi:Piwi-domain-containing protein [Venturia nashicola]|uniref:Piwi-domain-containing protein n=1 Tax=Venturia nashicola TaxID=86259 RepID=A0A4Z1NFB1_9PEZI|nr:Piwi-domain-containing protein [Venturia nashicola]